MDKHKKDFIKEYIICSAIHFDNKADIEHPHQPKNITSGFVLCGRRHHNCFATASILGFNRLGIQITQGFLTNEDRFLNREDAAKVAYYSGQIEELENSLMSEMLW